MAKLYFKYGAMGSSKTATALITKYNYEERGMKVWLIKPAADSRDGQFTLKSRIGLSSECEAISADKDIRTLYHAREKADVIIVDECQFMTMAQIDQLRELVDREPARKYYHLTDTGKLYQQEKKQEWLDFVGQVNRLLSDC